MILLFSNFLVFWKRHRNSPRPELWRNSYGGYHSEENYFYKHDRFLSSLGVFSAQCILLTDLKPRSNMAIERNPGVKAQDQDVLGKEYSTASNFSDDFEADLTYGYQADRQGPVHDPAAAPAPAADNRSPSNKDNYRFDIEAETGPLCRRGPLQQLPHRQERLPRI